MEGVKWGKMRGFEGVLKNEKRVKKMKLSKIGGSRGFWGKKAFRIGKGKFLEDERQE